MVEVIDAFAHVMPKPIIEELLELLPNNENFRRYEGQKGEFMWDIENHHIPDMEEYGIDRQVISLAVPQIWQYDGLTTDDALDLCRKANTEMRRVADEHPDRFVPVGTIPDVSEGFLDEFDRCIDDLDMAGIQIYSTIDGKPLDDESVLPLYQRAVEKDVPLWLHPTLNDWLPSMEYIERAVYGLPFDTGMALCRLVFGGVVEQYPDLQVIPHHCGGVIPHFDGRLDSIFERPDHYQHDPDQFSKPILEYFREFHADTVLNGSVHALECGHDFFGDGQLVFATDYPFGAEDGRQFMRENLAAVERADIDDAERERIFSGTLRSIADV